MSKLIGIYQITSPSNKIYIGQSWDIQRRWYLYSLGHCVAQRHLHNSIKKYGFEMHRREVLEVFPGTVEQLVLDAREQFFMDLRSGEGFTLLNLRGGGSTGKLSEETKEKIRIANTGFNPTQETRRKLSQWQFGRKRPHISESNRRRAAAGTMYLQTRIAPRGKDHPRFGLKHTPEALAKMSTSHKGQIVTDEHKARISARVRGELNPSCRLTETEVIAIRCKYDPLRYMAKDLALEYGISKHTIRRILCGRIWKYLVAQYPVRRRDDHRREQAA